METTVDKNELLKLAKDFAKDIKSESEFEEFSRAMRKSFIETALEAEMDEHLGYEKHDTDGRGSGNSRNGKSTKRLKGDHGEVDLDVPRDRAASFDPQIVRKGQRRMAGMDERILYLYAKGMSTREIADSIKEFYGVDVSASLISRVTDRVIDRATEWQSRSLDPIYPIVYLDCIVLKIRQNQRVINKSMYLALGVNLDGHKELLGLWLAETEGAKFWLSVLAELKTRGLKDILIACVDGLKGFPEVIEAEYPQTKIQLCIVHMVRNSLRFVPWKDYKYVTRDLKTIYHAASEAEAQANLDAFAETWDEKYPQISKSWRDNWANLATLFVYPPEIRKAIYTTNAIESLNSVIRKATRKRKVFPTDQSAIMVAFLAIQEASKKWTMPIRNWKPALNRFSIEFEERITDYL